MTLRLPTALTFLLLAGALGQGLACTLPASSDDDDSSSANSDDDDTAVSPCEGIDAEVHEISPAELNEMMADKDFELINVHIPHAGEIPGTDVHIPYTDLAALEEHLGGDVGAKAVLYCLTGPMSSIAADDLIERGYCQIYDLPAGMVGWQAVGFPVDQ